MSTLDKIEISFNFRSSGADIAVVSATRHADFAPAWLAIGRRARAP
jgi:hypothetical protein